MRILRDRSNGVHPMNPPPAPANPIASRPRMRLKGFPLALILGGVFLWVAWMPLGILLMLLLLIVPLFCPYAAHAGLIYLTLLCVGIAVWGACRLADRWWQLVIENAARSSESGGLRWVARLLIVELIGIGIYWFAGTFWEVNDRTGIPPYSPNWNTYPVGLAFQKVALLGVPILGLGYLGLRGMSHAAAKGLLRAALFCTAVVVMAAEIAFDGNGCVRNQGNQGFLTSQITWALGMGVFLSIGLGLRLLQTRSDSSRNRPTASPISQREDPNAPRCPACNAPLMLFDGRCAVCGADPGVYEG